jgi:site-specific recombinase XerD
MERMIMEDLKKQFVSVLASQFVKMIEEKRAFGYKYEELGVFRRLDRFLVEHNLKKIALPQSMVELWVKRRNFELSRTLGNRISAVRLLAEFLIRQGIPAYYPDKYSTEKIVYNFTPYIFSHAEITSLIKNSDELRQIMKNHPYSWKYRHFSVVPCDRLALTSGKQ